MSKIQDLVFKEEEYKYNQPFHITNSVSTASRLITVKLHLKQGIVGLGQASLSFRVNGEVYQPLWHYREAMLNKIHGLDVRNYRRAFREIDGFSRTAPSLKAAVQYAVLDALSQDCGLPVFQLLGGARDYVETDMTIGIDSRENTVNRAREAFEQGFEVLKLKVGEDLNTDIERVLAVAEATPGAEYIIDANLGYTPKQALRFTDSMYQHDVEIALFEQPVSVHDFAGLRLVRQHCPYPVGADESVKSKYDAWRLIEEECVDFINIKLMKSGISDALAIVEQARSADIGLMIGCMGEAGIGINQSVQFAAGTGAFSYHDLDSAFLLQDADPVGYRVEGNRLYPGY
ncbi:MAG: enolase C-terminal domain-like protein [Bacillota bacterium]